MYILILMMHVGIMGNGNSNALSTAEFNNEQKCIDAGKKAVKMSEGTVKEIKFVCSAK